jgi:hypothetical protein
VGTFLAIHAGKKVEKEAIAFLQNEFGLVCPDQLPTGSIVAVAKYKGVYAIPPTGPDRWWVGPVGWKLEEVVKLATPVECKGQQQLWQVPTAALQEIRKQWKRRQRDAQTLAANLR